MWHSNSNPTCFKRNLSDIWLLQHRMFFSPPIHPTPHLCWKLFQAALQHFQFVSNSWALARLVLWWDVGLNSPQNSKKHFIQLCHCANTGKVNNIKSFPNSEIALYQCTILMLTSQVRRSSRQGFEVSIMAMFLFLFTDSIFGLWNINIADIAMALHFAICNDSSKKKRTERISEKEFSPCIQLMDVRMLFEKTSDFRLRKRPFLPLPFTNLWSCLVVRTEQDLWESQFQLGQALLLRLTTSKVGVGDFVQETQ